MSSNDAFLHQDSEQLLHSRLKSKKCRPVPAGGNPLIVQDGMQSQEVCGSACVKFRLLDALTAQSRHVELTVHCHGHKHHTLTACMAVSPRSTTIRRHDNF